MGSVGEGRSSAEVSASDCEFRGNSGTFVWLFIYTACSKRRFGSYSAARWRGYVLSATPVELFELYGTQHIRQCREHANLITLPLD